MCYTYTSWTFHAIYPLFLVLLTRHSTIVTVVTVVSVAKQFCFQASDQSSSLQPSRSYYLLHSRLISVPNEYADTTVVPPLILFRFLVLVRNKSNTYTNPCTCFQSTLVIVLSALIFTHFLHLRLPRIFQTSFYPNPLVISIVHFNSVILVPC